MNTFSAKTNGTGFVPDGPAPVRSPAMTALVPQRDTDFTRRQRDRRTALADLLAALMRSLDRNDGALRLVFEEAMRRIVPVRSVQLRDGSARSMGRSEGVVGTESIVFDVPGVDHLSQGILEATFDP